MIWLLIICFYVIPAILAFASGSYRRISEYNFLTIKDLVFITWIGLMPFINIIFVVIILWSITSDQIDWNKIIYEKKE